jgi:hypothetical protein
VTPAVATAECLACGRPDLLGLGLCPECGGAGEPGDSLVFIRRSASGADRREVADRVSAILGERADTPDGRAALRGDLALVRVPSIVAPVVIDALEARGVPARTMDMRRAWLAMPSHFFLLIVLIACVGAMAGVAGAAPMLYASPALAMLLVLVAQRSMRRPLLRAPVADSLPAAVETAVLQAFSRLAAGRPRELLADLVGMGRPLIGQLHREGDPAGLVATLEDLLLAASQTALETDHLLDAGRVVRGEIEEDGAKPNRDLRAAAERCERAADIGIQRLVEAVAAIADISGRAAALDDGAALRLANLTRELQANAEVHDVALREVDRLLAR